MAVDDRIAAAAPVNMISFISQGGGCQEAANIRVEANNVMFGAMMAIEHGWLRVGGRLPYGSTVMVVGRKPDHP